MPALEQDSHGVDAKPQDAATSGLPPNFSAFLKKALTSRIQAGYLTQKRSATAQENKGEQQFNFFLKKGE
ncbi:hypothetical protein [Candidatus Electronema sp. TJ]|uniref:hypothetical protein n=1 Tax=Candidatus Electronema sp. TJ TaxID=3401573 RepID=UPI003AA7B176